MWFNNFGRMPSCEASCNGWKDPKPISDRFASFSGWQDPKPIRTTTASPLGERTKK